MNKCAYYDRIEIVDGKLTRIVMAVRAATRRQPHAELDIYREFEDGHAECRNLYVGMYGYYVSFPDEFDSVYKHRVSQFVQELQAWGGCDLIKAFPSGFPTQHQKEIIVNMYPAFKYVLGKWCGNIRDTFRVLRIWKEHREIELPLSAGFEHVAMSKSLYRLSGKKRSEIIRFMCSHAECSEFSLLDIQRILKNGYDVMEYREYKEFISIRKNISFDLYRYIIRQPDPGMALTMYRDYMNMLTETEHDPKSTYWKFPKNLAAAHDKIRDEVERIRALKHRKEFEQRQGAYGKAVRKFVKFNGIVDGYHIFVPENIEEWDSQAKALHQCIITCDYVSHVIKKSCVLVFIRKDGKPVATAQVMRDGSVGQFYADEIDRKDCLPDERVRAAFEKWLGTARIKIA